MSVSKNKRPKIDAIEPIGDAPVALGTVIAESKETLAQAAPKPKKGRPSNAEIEAREAEARKAAEAQAAEFAKYLKPALEHGVGIPFDVAAQKTGFEGWRLTPEEKDALATQVDSVLKRYLPEVDSEYSEIIALGASFLMIGVGHYIAYSAWKKDEAEKTAKLEAEKKAASPTPFVDPMNINA